MARRSIANLSVSVTARTRGLKKGLKGAQRDLAKFTRTVTKSIAIIGGIGAAVATAVGVGVTRQINDLSELAKTARKLSDFDPTALQAIRDLAEQSGVAANTADMALQRMLRRIQQASIGKGEAVSVLKTLGLDAKELIRLAPSKQFEMVAAAIRRTRGDGRELAKLMALFDSEGVAIGNTFDALAKNGLKPFIKEVQDGGRSLSKSQLDAIESVEDRWFRLTKRIGGIFTQLTSAISGPLDRMLGKLENFLKTPEASASINNFFQEMRERIGGIDGSLGSLSGNFSKFLRFIDMAKNSINSFLVDTVTLFVFVGKKIGEVIAQVQRISAVFDPIGDVFNRIDGFARNSGQAVRTLIQEISEGVASADTLSKQMADFMNGNGVGGNSSLDRLQNSIKRPDLNVSERFSNALKTPDFSSTAKGEKAVEMIGKDISDLIKFLRRDVGDVLQSADDAFERAVVNLPASNVDSSKVGPALFRFAERFQVVGDGIISASVISGNALVEGAQKAARELEKIAETGQIDLGQALEKAARPKPNFSQKGQVFRLERNGVPIPGFGQQQQQGGDPLFIQELRRQTAEIKKLNLKNAESKTNLMTIKVGG